MSSQVAASVVPDFAVANAPETIGTRNVMA
jgi:hypothetical protein